MKTYGKTFLQLLCFIILSGAVVAQPGAPSKIEAATGKINQMEFRPDSPISSTILDVTSAKSDVNGSIDLSVEAQDKQLQMAIQEGQEATAYINSIEEAQIQRELEYQEALAKAAFSDRPDFFIAAGGSDLLETVELVIDLFSAPEFGGVIGVDPAIEDPSSPEFKERQNQLAAAKAKQEQEQKAKEAAAKAEKERLEKEYHERMEKHHSELERFKSEKENYRCPF